MRDDARPEGFPPGLWVLLRNTKTFVSLREDGNYPHLHNCAIRKADLVIEDDVGGYWVHEVKDSAVELIKKQERLASQRGMGETASLSSSALASASASAF